jgi:hypothetical protein
MPTCAAKGRALVHPDVFYARTREGTPPQAIDSYMGRGGNFSRLTPEVAEQFFRHFRESGHFRASADSIGLGSSTLYYWVQRGRVEYRGKFHDFLVEFEKIRGEQRALRAARHHRIAMGESSVGQRPKPFSATRGSRFPQMR